MCALCMKEMRRKPSLVQLAFAELSRRVGGCFKSILLHLRLWLPWLNRNHLLRVRPSAFGWLAVWVCAGTKLLQSLCCLQPQPHTGSRLATTRCHSGGIVFHHLSQSPTISICYRECQRYLPCDLEPETLTSFSALFLNRFGTRLTLWLAVRLRRSFGTLWNALVVRAFLDLLSPASRALISYSRALTNLSTSSCPSLSALSDVCTAIVRASWVFARFLSRPVASACGAIAVVEGILLRFEDAVKSISGKKLGSLQERVATLIDFMSEPWTLGTSGAKDGGN